MTIRRDPAEETRDLYPGLVVHDGRVGGSITLGPSRLPIWAIPLAFSLDEGWPYAAERYGVSESDLAEFARHLLSQRGEIARLLLMLARAAADDEREQAKEVERVGEVTAKNGVRLIELDTEAVASLPGQWHEEDSEARRAIVAQFRRCLEALERSAPQGGRGSGT